MTSPQEAVPANRSRRAEYAEATRRAAVDAARHLFSEKGYFATTVNEIAAAARVSPATVYAVNGGKQGLLRTLIDDWSADAPIIAEGRTQIENLDDPIEILRYLTEMTRQMRQEFGDIMRVVIATAPHDTTAAEGFALATSRWRDFETFVGQRLSELDALRPGMAPDEAADILWLYLGYGGFATLVDDNGWSYERAEKWLYNAVRHALLRPTRNRR